MLVVRQVRRPIANHGYHRGLIKGQRTNATASPTSLVRPSSTIAMTGYLHVVYQNNFCRQCCDSYGYVVVFVRPASKLKI